MTRRTQRGRAFLRPKRPGIRKRGLRGVEVPVVVPLMIRGQMLTIPETIIYHALTDLHIPFEAQLPLGGGRQLGGAIVDFWLPKHHVVVEFQGVFHDSAQGRAADFVRAVNRRRLLGAIDIVEIFQRDIDHIHRVLKDKVGVAEGH